MAEPFEGAVHRARWPGEPHIPAARIEKTQRLPCEQRVADIKGQAIERHGERFLEKVYTAEERAHCGGRVESLAARFAAKEAAAKALQTGVWRQGIGWTDLEVVRDEASGAPGLRLHNAAARLAAAHKLHGWSISLSHDRTHAIAFVAAIGEGPPIS